jgi:phage-related protein
MSVVGPRCHELRVKDDVARVQWRVMLRADPDAVLVLHIFHKQTDATPRAVIDACQRILKRYDQAAE